MTFGQEALIKIGQLFSGRDRQHDTAEIADIMGCKEADIYNALSEHRSAYRAHKAWHREHQSAVRGKSGVAA
ncbi:hypothetical protein AKG11_31050 [Shinella sp. SUS2]|uniref:hypothetical protein n=1 Tax=unclassified Shinella TaxID=2643062 RepID=UPI0006812848|nr:MULTISPECIES: hypothetical protein [unclassified Shinella]KNY13110.1 hypothetical protein AKG11_31050 [Shinella sp. SUS2]KOC71895.1 hypothetical protein AKG10_30470 [Shinella sp. GWS1]